jgi:hypothetical protein
MAGLMTHVNYISDDGSTYRLRQDLSNATAAGNPTATSSVHAPAGYKPRYIICTHPTTGRERTVAISDPANPLFVGGTSSITLTDFTTTPSAQVAYAVLARVGERRYNRG